MDQFKIEPQLDELPFDDPVSDEEFEEAKREIMEDFPPLEK